VPAGGGGRDSLLIAIGLVLAPAVHVTPAGILGLVKTYAIFAPRRRRTQVIERTALHPPAPDPRYDQRYDEQGRTVDDGLL
jgi:hypothetical protein